MNDLKKRIDDSGNVKYVPYCSDQDILAYLMFLIVNLVILPFSFYNRNSQFNPIIVLAAGVGFIFLCVITSWKKNLSKTNSIQQKHPGLCKFQSDSNIVAYLLTAIGYLYSCLSFTSDDRVSALLFWLVWGAFVIVNSLILIADLTAESKAKKNSDPGQG